MGKQLIEKLLFLSRIDQYIDGAHQQGNKQAELSLQILRAVEQKNTSLLQDFLIAERSATDHHFLARIDKIGKFHATKHRTIKRKSSKPLSNTAVLRHVYYQEKGMKSKEFTNNNIT